MHRLVVGAFAVAGFALVAGPAAQAACGRVSAQGEGLTKEIAQEVAKMNLEFAVVAKGAKAAGKAALKCGAPGPLLMTSCTAKQRACT
jgi:hypothetical protein